MENVKSEKCLCPKCHKYQGKDIIYEDEILRDLVYTKRHPTGGCLDWSDFMTYQCVGVDINGKKENHKKNRYANWFLGRCKIIYWYTQLFFWF